MERTPDSDLMLLKKVLRTTKNSTPMRAGLPYSAPQQSAQHPISQEQLRCIRHHCQTRTNTALVVQQLISFFDFTQSEALVSAHYAKGLAVADIVHRTGYTQSTVRTHIRNAFRKLDISRQSQLTVFIKTRLFT